MEETPAQLAYRLRPRLEFSDPSAAEAGQDLSPLLSLAKETPLRVRVVLAYGGTEKIPSSKQLAAIEALDMPTWERIATNLAQLQSMDPPLLPEVVTMGKEISAFKLPIDRPGAESLLLLPALWDKFMEWEKPLVAALPSRGGLFFIIDEPANLKVWGKTLSKLYEEASEPMVDRFFHRKEGKLVPGKTFAEAGKD